MLDVFENMKKSIEAQMDFIDALTKTNAERGLEILRLTQANGDLETTVQGQTRAIRALNQNNLDLQGLVDRLRSLNEELRQAANGKGSGHMENGVSR